MKKFFVLILVVGVISFYPVAFAEDMQDMGNAPQQQQQQGEGQMGGPGMMGGGMRGGGRGMGMGPMGMMGGKESMVATSDGGIVVMAGPKLMKYDRDLNLVKEVEIKKGKGPGPEKNMPPQNNSGDSGNNGPAEEQNNPAPQQ